jgi:hypothetical protein
MPYRPQLLLVCCALLLSACSSNYVFIKKDDLSQVQAQLSLQQEKLEKLESMQEQALKTVIDAQQASTEKLQSSMVLPKQEIAPNNKQCAKAAVLVCPPPNNTIDTLANTMNEKQLIGAVEKIHFPGLNSTLKSRIDTGATTSSIDARNIKYLERDGQRWVRFDFFHPENNTIDSYEYPVSRVIRVKQANTEDVERRPVIELHFNLGNISQSAQFSLTDRKHLDFSALIGRNILKDLMLVDVSKKYIAPLPANAKPVQSSKPTKP